MTCYIYHSVVVTVNRFPRERTRLGREFTETFQGLGPNNPKENNRAFVFSMLRP